MKNEMMLDLGGMTYEIEFISSPVNAGDQIMIELADERALSVIAADFEGRSRIVKTDTLKVGVETVYSGFTELTSIQRNAITGSVRITLRKP